MSKRLNPIKGRGTASNPPNRFETIERISCRSDREASKPRTEFLSDTTKNIISRNNSPDIPFEASINCYRGCEHGCIYCYARPSHEYLGYSAGLDFETKIFVKKDAPTLLRDTLSHRNWKPKILAMSGVTDPYQAIEQRLGLTRQCLEVLVHFRNPVVIITKNSAVVRDADLLSQLAKFDAAAVYLSITTLNDGLHRILEPRTTRPEKRFSAISELARSGVPTGVMLAPIIPGLTDSEIPKMIASAAGAGASFACMIPLRLPHGVASLFENWLEAHLPDQKAKILHRVREIRDGKLNDTGFFSRMKGNGPYAEQISDLFTLSCRKAKIKIGGPALSTQHFRTTRPVQLGLFT